uniref:ADP,ATP carrier protein n=1 Tax=Steinernema glaseri TaxID=37863 RepID=A0A1I7YMS0_9BILA
MCAIFAHVIIVSVAEIVHFGKEAVYPINVDLFREEFYSQRFYAAMSVTVLYLGLYVNLLATTERPLISRELSQLIAGIFSLVAFATYMLSSVFKLTAWLIHPMGMIPAVVLLGLIMAKSELSLRIKKMFESTTYERYLVKGSTRIRRNRKTVAIMLPGMYVNFFASLCNVVVAILSVYLKSVVFFYWSSLTFSGLSMCVAILTIYKMPQVGQQEDQEFDIALRFNRYLSVPIERFWNRERPNQGPEFPVENDGEIVEESRF